MNKYLLFLFLECLVFTGCTNGTGNNTGEIPDNEKDVEINIQPSEFQKDNQPSVLLHPFNIKDNGHLSAQAGNSYQASNLFDGDPSTGWAINIDDAQSLGEYIYGPTADVDAKRIDQICIQNGYGKNDAAFKNNHRAKWIEIYRNVGDGMIKKEDMIYAGVLKDMKEPQLLKVNQSFDNSRPTKTIGLRFYSNDKRDEGYYSGSKWNDLVISELEFYGVPLYEKSNLSKNNIIRFEEKLPDPTKLVSQGEQYLKTLGFKGSGKWVGETYQAQYQLSVDGKLCLVSYLGEDMSSIYDLTISGDEKALDSFFKKAYALNGKEINGFVCEVRIVGNRVEITMNGSE